VIAQRLLLAKGEGTFKTKRIRLKAPRDVDPEAELVLDHRNLGLLLINNSLIELRSGTEAIRGIAIPCFGKTAVQTLLKHDKRNYMNEPKKDGNHSVEMPKSHRPH